LNVEAALHSVTAALPAAEDRPGQLQMAQAVADVAAWNNKIKLLQTELGQASLSLAQTQNKFPTSAQTIEYDETLMGLDRKSVV